jgi:hypothetical protein
MVWRIFAPKFIFSVSLAGAALVGWAVAVVRAVSCSGGAWADDDRRRD